MVLRIVLSIVLGAVASFLAGPIHYYFRTAPQRAAFSEMARESEEELRRWGDTKSISGADYRAAMQRERERDARSRQLLAEKSRIRTQTRITAVVTLLVIGGGAFAGLSLLKRRSSPTATTRTQASSQ